MSQYNDKLVAWLHESTNRQGNGPSGEVWATYECMVKELKQLREELTISRKLATEREVALTRLREDRNRHWPWE